MSSLTGSILRYLERILGKIESGIASFKPSIPAALEYLLIKIVYYSDLCMNKFVYYVKRLSRIANLLQISMIDSMIVVSLWYGFLTLMLILIVLYLYSMR